MVQALNKDVQAEEEAILSQSLLSSEKGSRSRRFLRLVNLIAAITVVVLIISASLFLFRSRIQTSSGALPQSPSEKLVTVHAQVKGLDVTMQVTAGPYFLSELVEANVLVTNRSQKSVYVDRWCVNSPFGLETYGGGKPNYTFPDIGFFSCPPPFPYEMKPGETMKNHAYVPLTASGKVTLTMYAKLSTITRNVDGSQNIIYESAALPWPRLSINVAEHIPPDRVITLQREGTHIAIHAPAAALTHLLYMFGDDCRDVATGGRVKSIIFSWKSVALDGLKVPDCAKPMSWTYIISAPGYGIASSQYAA